MENAEFVDAAEIPHVDGQQLPNPMDIHARRQPGVMNLHTLNVVRDQKRPPAVVNLPTVRQKLEVSFDHTGQPIRFSDAQTEPILVERAGRGVPELAQGLRGVAEPYPCPTSA